MSVLRDADLIGLQWDLNADMIKGSPSISSLQSKMRITVVLPLEINIKQ